RRRVDADQALFALADGAGPDRREPATPRCDRLAWHADGLEPPGTDGKGAAFTFLGLTLLAAWRAPCGVVRSKLRAVHGSGKLLSSAPFRSLESSRCSRHAKNAHSEIYGEMVPLPARIEGRCASAVVQTARRVVQ